MLTIARWVIPTSGLINDCKVSKQSTAVARKGGLIAGDARMKLEGQTGRSVISSEKASDYLLPENTNEENDK